MNIVHTHPLFTVITTRYSFIHLHKLRQLVSHTLAMFSKSFVYSDCSIIWKQVP